MTTSRSKDQVVEPSHYTSNKGRQTWDQISEILGYEQDVGYMRGNVIKYLARFDKKNPEDPVQDLLKARQYLDRLIAVVSKGQG
jgi:hypothetical protein